MRDQVNVGTVGAQRHMLPTPASSGTYNAVTVSGAGVCLLCGKAFAAGDRWALVALGPGYDVKERARCAARSWFNAIAVVLHLVCLTGSDQPLEER
jgi:hypothetical protein